MRYVHFTLISATVCVVGFMVCHVAAEPESNTIGERTTGRMTMANAKPLLLLDDEPEEDPKAVPEADNSRCHVCHLNLAMEELAVTHARKGVGCNKCHGKCDAHIDDESWASGGPGTPPDIMYPPERIDPACKECHETHDVPATEIIQRLLDRCPDNAKSAQVVCTTCHGKHKSNPKLRKAWWDKKTGKPIAPSDRSAIQDNK